MKQFKTLIIIAAVAAVALTSVANDYWGFANPQTPVNSTAGSKDFTTLATNHTYTAGIAGNTTETNVQFINQGFQGNNLMIQVTASATSASTTNVTIVLTESVKTPVIVTTNNSATSVTPRGAFYTVTMALAGTTPVTTNLLFTPFSTPAFASGDNIYIESVTMGAAATACLTNYSVVVNQD